MEKYKKWQELSEFEQRILTLIFTRDKQNIELARVFLLGSLREANGDNFLPNVDKYEYPSDEKKSMWSALLRLEFEKMFDAENDFLKNCRLPFFFGYKQQGFNYFLNPINGFVDSSYPFMSITFNHYATTIDWQDFQTTIDCIKSYPMLKNNFLSVFIPIRREPIEAENTTRKMVSKYPKMPIFFNDSYDFRNYGVNILERINEQKNIMFDTKLAADNFRTKGSILHIIDANFDNVKNLHIYHVRDVSTTQADYEKMRKRLNELAKSKIWQANNITVQHI